MKAVRFVVAAVLVFATFPADSGEAGPTLGRIIVTSESFNFCLDRTGRWHSSIDLPSGGLPAHYESTALDKNRVKIESAKGTFKDMTFSAGTNAATGAVTGELEGINKNAVIKITASLGSSPNPTAVVKHTLKFKPVVHLNEDCV
jgi:hypothetical protein